MMLRQRGARSVFSYPTIPVVSNLLPSRAATSLHPPQSQSSPSPRRGGPLSLVPRWATTPGFVVGSMAAADALVYLGWKLAFRLSNRRRTSRPLDFMEDHFTSSYRNSVQLRRPWTLVTSVFSHAEFGHLLSNLNALYSTGLPLAQIVGPARFSALYLAAGAASSASLVLVDAVRRWRAKGRRGARPQGIGEPNLGGSGAVTGLVTAFACAFPHSILLVNGYVRLPVIIETAATLVYDAVNVGREHLTGVSHAGHFAGALCGVLSYFLLLRRLRLR